MYYQTKVNKMINLITVPVTNTKAVTVLVLVPVGSRYETDHNIGASHFIEHMMFKGTKRRPTNLLIAKELDALGAEYNAYTSKDLTAYWLKLDKNFLPQGLDILSDMLLNSLFDKGEFQREKRVIIEEIKMYQENPLLYIDDFFEQTLYKQTSLGRSISGKINNIKNITLKNLLGFKSRHYSLANLNIILAGNINHRQSVELISKYFKGSKCCQNKIMFKTYKARSISSPKINTLLKEGQQAQLAIGFPGYPYLHPDLDSLVLLSIILGGNMSSRLFTEVRVRRGLAYAIKSDLSIYQDTGAFYVQAGVDTSRILEASKVILDELKSIKQNGPLADEVHKTKTFFAGKLSLDLEDSADMASWYGRQYVLTHKVISPQQRLARINRVTSKTIQGVANMVFQRKYLHFAMIGPLIDQKKLLSILSNSL